MGTGVTIEMLEPRALCAAAYAVYDLGTLGGSSSKAYAINASGQIVGESTNSAGQTRAFLYTGGKMTNLVTLGGSRSIAYGVNDAGLVVGESTTSDGRTRGFVFGGGAMRTLAPLAGGSESHAFAINNGGQVAGFSSITGGALRAVRWSSTGIATNLGTFSGASSTSGYGINPAGNVVGNASTSSGNRGFLYSSGAIKNLGTLARGNKSHFYGVNSRNWATGESTLANGQTHAVVYRDGVVKDLGTLAGGTYSHAYGINYNGDVAGQAKTSGGSLRAIAYFASSSSMRDLNTMIPSGTGWTLVAAHAITDDGRIVGYGSKGGQSRAFLLLPTPAGSISGTVFHDADGDAIRDAGEGAMSAWRVFIDADRDGRYDEGERNVLTDANGNWILTDLSAGVYTIRVGPAEGWKVTTPTTIYHRPTLVAGDAVTKLLFGVRTIG